MEDMTFMQRFAAVQEELKAPKSRTNSFGGYKYRSCEDILKAAKPLLHRYGLLLTLTDEIRALEGRFYVAATAIIHDTTGLHTLQATACAREAEVKKGMDDSQITGTASSYARKYALNGLFCLDDVTDADAAKREAEEELFADIKCDGCGYKIHPHNDGKKGYTPIQIAKASQRRFKKNLCWDCSQAAIAEQNGGN